jgi:hypothetical protein
MVLSNLEYIYCLGSYEKEQCHKCKRNINLYEYDKMKIQLFWNDGYKIRNSKAKICPDYRVLNEK